MIGKIVDRFEPAFLKRLDRYLLLHHPNLWGMRIHYVLYAAVVMNLLACLPLLYPLKLYHVDEVGLLSAVLLITFTGSILALSPRSSVESEFGPTSPRGAVWRYVGYVVCAGALMSSLATFRLTTASRYSQMVTGHELDADFADLKWREFPRLVVRDSVARPSSEYQARLLRRAALSMKYTNKPLDGEEFVSTYEAQRNVVAVADLVGHPLDDDTSWIIRPATMDLLMIYGISLAMYCFVAGYMGRGSLASSVGPSLLPLWGFFVLPIVESDWAPEADAGYAPSLFDVTQQVPLAVLACTIFFLLWHASRALRNGVSSPFAEISLAGLCLMLPAMLQLAVFRLVPREAVTTFAILAMIPVVLCIPALHNVLTTMISLPRR